MPLPAALLARLQKRGIVKATEPGIKKSRLVYATIENVLSFDYNVTFRSFMLKHKFFFFL